MALSHANDDNPKIVSFRKNTALKAGDHILFGKVWHPAKPQTAWAMRLIDHTVNRPLSWKPGSTDLNGDMLLIDGNIKSKDIKLIAEMLCHVAGLQGHLETYQESEHSCWYEIVG